MAISPPLGTDYVCDAEVVTAPDGLLFLLSLRFAGRPPITVAIGRVGAWWLAELGRTSVLGLVKTAEAELVCAVDPGGGHPPAGQELRPDGPGPGALAWTLAQLTRRPGQEAVVIWTAPGEVDPEDVGHQEGEALPLSDAGALPQGCPSTRSRGARLGRPSHKGPLVATPRAWRSVPPPAHCAGWLPGLQGEHEPTSQRHRG